MIIFLLSLLSLHSLTGRAAESLECKARYDSLGIPHEVVSSLEHFYFCFGYHHGKDRAWEMDYFRRVAQGRNAEVLGYSQLKSDLMMRLLNLPAVAERILDSMKSEERKLLEYYAQGANKGFEEGKEAQEFIDLGYVPEPWRPIDTLSVLLVQSFDQTRKTFSNDYLEEQHQETWGDKASELFNEEGMPWENNILKEGEYPEEKIRNQEVNRVQKKYKLWSSFPSVFGEKSGSNNWVISGEKSKTGNAILANDPHLDLKTPLFWYWVHLKSPSFESIGASLPGVPVIASGTNGKVAWGLTNAYINSADAVFLKDPSNDSIESFRPTVWIKFWFFKIPFFFKSFERLKSGHPILPLETQRDDKVALRWTGFSLKPEEVLPMFDLNTVQNVEEMNALLQTIGIPAWNFVFADTKGDIGFRVVGNAYRHVEKTPYGISVESVEKFHNEDFLSPEERPHILKPARNYVYTANNRHWPLDAAFYGGRAYSFSFRGFRIDELLQGQHDTESFKAIQCDRQVVDARFFLPEIFKYIESPILSSWKMNAGDDSAELSLYRRLMDIMMEEWKVNEYALYRLLQKVTPERKNEVQKFYERALKDVQGRGWAEFHRLGFNHLSKNEEWVFSPEMPGVGDNHTVDPGTSRWNESKKIYEQYSGASMRMIIEMSERPKIHLVLPGFNREYSQNSESTPWKEWRDCRYSEVSF
jgi:penicillin amidase